MNIPAITGYQMCTSPSCAYNKQASVKKPPSEIEMIKNEALYGELNKQDKFVKSETKPANDLKDMNRKMSIMHSAGGGTN